MTTPAAPGQAASPAPQLSREDLLARFGMTESVLKSDRSLASLFSRAVAGSYSVARFNAELQNTKWFKSHNKVWRETWLLSKTDPATHAQLNLQARAKVEELMREYGLGTLSNAQWKKVADQLQIESRWQGFNDAQLRKLVVTKIPLLKEGQLYGGKLGAWQSKLMDIAYANGIKLSPGNVGWWTRAIAAGSQTMETAEHDIRKRAANTYVAYKDQILAGQDVMDIASPYIQLASKLLEMPEGKLGLTDGLIKRFMTAKDTKTGQAVATPLWQAEEMIRNDARWMKTNNAQDEMMQTAHKIAQDFGLAY